MNKRTVWIIAAGAGLVLWYLFRPELLFIGTKVHEEFPLSTVHAASGSERSAKAVLAGQFHGVAHETMGRAAVYEGGDGMGMGTGMGTGMGVRFLRLTGFKTSNGPDVRVYLVAAPDAMDNETVKKAGFVELGRLKGTEGDQNYEVPASVDLTTHRSVTIWCARFGVNFGTAPLAEL